MRLRMPVLMVLLFQVITGFNSRPEKPNIMWITAEDITTMLGCYGDVNAARAFEETWQLLPEFPEEVVQLYPKLQEGKWYGYDLYAFWSLSQVFANPSVYAPEETNYSNQ